MTTAQSSIRIFNNPALQATIRELRQSFGGSTVDCTAWAMLQYVNDPNNADKFNLFDATMFDFSNADRTACHADAARLIDEQAAPADSFTLPRYRDLDAADDDEAGFSDLESGFDAPAPIAGPVLDENGKSWYDRHKIAPAPVTPAPAAIDTGATHGPSLAERIPSCTRCGCVVRPCFTLCADCRDAILAERRSPETIARIAARQPVHGPSVEEMAEPNACRHCGIALPPRWILCDDCRARGLSRLPDYRNGKLIYPEPAPCTDDELRQADHHELQALADAGEWPAYDAACARYAARWSNEHGQVREIFIRSRDGRVIVKTAIFGRFALAQSGQRDAQAMTPDERGAELATLRGAIAAAEQVGDTITASRMRQRLIGVASVA